MDITAFTVRIGHPAVFIGGPLDGMAASVMTGLGVPPSQIAPKLPRRLRTQTEIRAGYRLDVTQDAEGNTTAVPGPPLRHSPGTAFRYVYDPSVTTKRSLFETVLATIAGGDVSAPFPARHVVLSPAEIGIDR